MITTAPSRPNRRESKTEPALWMRPPEIATAWFGMMSLLLLSLAACDRLTSSRLPAPTAGECQMAEAALSLPTTRAEIASLLAPTGHGVKDVFVMAFASQPYRPGSRGLQSLPARNAAWSKCADFSRTVEAMGWRGLWASAGDAPGPMIAVSRALYSAPGSAVVDELYIPGPLRLPSGAYAEGRTWHVAVRQAANGAWVVDGVEMIQPNRHD
jgi:hypothetical protein